MEKCELGLYSRSAWVNVKLLMTCRTECRYRLKFGTTVSWTKGAITSKIKHAIKHKTGPARLAQLLHNCCTGRWAVIGCKLKQNANEGCNSCASLAGSMLSFIACMFYFTCDRSLRHVESCDMELETLRGKKRGRSHVIIQVSKRISTVQGKERVSLPATASMSVPKHSATSTAVATVTCHNVAYKRKGEINYRNLSVLTVPCPFTNMVYFSVL